MPLVLAAVEVALLLLRRHELPLHQIHLLLEALHRAFETQPLRLLQVQGRLQQSVHAKWRSCLRRAFAVCWRSDMMLASSCAAFVSQR